MEGEDIVKTSKPHRKAEPEEGFDMTSLSPEETGLPFAGTLGVTPARYAEYMEITGNRTSRVELIVSPSVATMRTRLESLRPWLESVLQCPWSETLSLDVRDGWDPPILPDVLPGASVGPESEACILPNPSRWELAPGCNPHLQIRRYTRRSSGGPRAARWKSVWGDAPVALWFASLTHPIVTVNLSYVAEAGSDSPEERTSQWLLLNPADAAAALRLLQDCAAVAKKTVHVQSGPDLTLTADDYCWERLILDPATARFVRDDYEGFLRREEWFRSRGLPFRRGYLFYGPPGNGKTSAIRVMAAHPAVAAFVVDLSAKHLEDEDLTAVFADAVEQGPSLVILEDLDRFFELPVGSRRVSLQHLLNCLDGLANGDGLIVVATANNISQFDRALVRRPGRFDRVIEFGLPKEEERREFLRRRLSGILSADSVIRLARQTSGFSFAQMKEAHVIAGQLAFDRGEEITAADLGNAVNQVKVGLAGLKQSISGNCIGFAEPAPAAPEVVNLAEG